MGLLDFIWNRKKTPIGQSSGVPGVSSFGGMLVSWEQSPDLQGRNRYLTYSNMISNTVVVGAAVRYFQSLIGGTSWTVTAREGSGKTGDKAVDVVNSGLFEANMTDTWSTCVKRQALYRMYGFAMHEWTMRRRKDGMMVYANLGHRPQSTIEFWDLPDDGSGPLQGVVQRPLLDASYHYMARSRLWYSVDNSLTDSPDGIGVLRNVVEHSRRLGRYEQLEGYAFETDMRGMPVARIPYQALKEYQIAQGLSDAWYAAQIKPLETLAANHVKTPNQGIAIDSKTYATTALNPSVSAVPMFALELLKGDGQGLLEVAATIERINREIARVLGMEFMMLGGDGKGSLALSQDKTSMFASMMEAALHELAEATVRDLVFPLLSMNGIDPELYCPRVLPDPIATERIELTVDALLKLAQAGAVLMPDDPAIDQIRARLHLADQPALPPELIGTLARPRSPMAPQDPNAPGDGTDGADQTSGDASPKNKPTQKRRHAFRVPKQRGES